MEKTEADKCLQGIRLCLLSGCTNEEVRIYLTKSMRLDPPCSIEEAENIILSVILAESILR